MSPVPLPISRKTVLVVEDDALVRALASRALEDAGFAVLEVASAEEALGFALMDVAFDALVTDIGLAGAIDGFELAETLAEMRPGLPVFYTAWARSEAAPQVADAELVAKPYNPIALAALVRRRLSPTNHRPDIAPAAPCVILSMQPRKAMRA